MLADFATHNMDKLDSKQVLDTYLVQTQKQHEIYPSKNKLQLGDGSISNYWVIDDFLLPSQIDHLIDIISKSRVSRNVDSEDFRYKLFFFEREPNLQHIIQENLQKSYVINQIQDNKIHPYGFNNEIEWKGVTGEINNCFRFSKFESVGDGFAKHRDASYTESECVKSAYSIVIYLNTVENSGTNLYNVPLGSPGSSIKEEFAQFTESGGQIATTFISAVKGRALIFDQRVIHESVDKTPGRMILRTDLKSYGELKDKEMSALNMFAGRPAWAKETASLLFRTAQSLELKSTSQMLSPQEKLKIDELYERAISMRCWGSRAHISIANENALLALKDYKKVKINGQLSFETMSDNNEFVYLYDGGESPSYNTHQIIKMCGMFTACAHPYIVTGISIPDNILYFIENMFNVGIDVDSCEKMLTITDCVIEQDTTLEDELCIDHDEVPNNMGRGLLYQAIHEEPDYDKLPIASSDYSHYGGNHIEMINYLRKYSGWQIPKRVWQPELSDLIVPKKKTRRARRKRDSRPRIVNPYDSDDNVEEEGEIMYDLKIDECSKLGKIPIYKPEVFDKYKTIGLRLTCEEHTMHWSGNGCGLCDIGPPTNNQYFYKISDAEPELNLCTAVIVPNNEYSGSLLIRTPQKIFNHASCQCCMSDCMETSDNTIKLPLITQSIKYRVEYPKNTQVKVYISFTPEVIM